MSTDYADIASRLQAVIEMAIDGIITINARGEIESLNKAASSLFGYDESELIGQNVKMLMPIDDARQHDQYINNYVTTRVPKIIGIGRNVEGKRKDGTVFPFRLAVSEVFLNDRVIFTGVVHDISEIVEGREKLEQVNASLEKKVQERTDELESVVNRLLATNAALKKSEKELTASLQKEKELSELKSRFVSMASHEFRTPLSTILSSAALISKYPTEAQQANREKHISRIKSAVDNLTGILNDFLSLSKLEEGKISANTESIDLSKLLLELLEEMKALDTRGINISLDGPNSYRIDSDPRILKNIFFNLVSNAIKYGRSEGTVKIQMEDQADQVVIHVIDDGLGIPLQDQKHLFSRFFRAQNVENIKGTGLGLHIVKRYVEMLEGSITFRSKESQGTTFTVTLPKTQ